MDSRRKVKSLIKTLLVVSNRVRLRSARTSAARVLLARARAPSAVWRSMTVCLHRNIAILAQPRRHVST